MDWGCQCWYAETASAYAFPTKPTPDDQKAFSDHYVNLAKTLPCKNCRKHWALIVHEEPPDTRSRRTLTRWIHKQHNKVNDHVRAQPPLKSLKGKRPWAQTHSRNPTLAEIDAKFRVPKTKTKIARKSIKPSKKL